MANEETKVEETKTETEEVKVEETSETKDKKESKKEKNKYKEKIAELEQELAKSKEDYLRVLADMQNTKKRLQEENVKDRKYASQKVVGELINPIDMLVKIVNMPAPSPEIQNYLIGFQMIANQLVSVLEGEGLKEIKSTNCEFDPNTMQAMAIVETNDVEPNMVVETMQTGYMYKDRVLRPSLVKVSKAVEEKKENTEEQTKGEE